MVKNTNNRSKRRDNLITLLFLLMIFSMYLVLRLHSLPKFLNGSSALGMSKTIYSITIVPLAMGIALLFSARRAANKSLRCIYLVSILPFIISPDVFFFFNQLLISIINIILTFSIMLLIIKYFIKNCDVGEG